MKLIFCLGANRRYPAIARANGWHIGARLPCTVYPDYAPLAFADQNWHTFDGLTPDDPAYQQHLARYVAAVATHRPSMASVIDFEAGRTLDEITQWCGAVAPYVERLMIIPKIPGAVDAIPQAIAGRPIVLGVSIPTRHGATSCLPDEFAGRAVHLLGGSIRQQLQWAGALSALNCEIVSADGNSFHAAAGRGTYWTGRKWANLGSRVLSTEEALRRSLAAIPQTWRALGWTVEIGPVSAHAALCGTEGGDPL